MTAFRRVLAEKRIAVAAVGIVLAADLLLYVLAVQPARAGVVQAAARAARAAGDAAARTADVAAARARLAGTRQAGEQLTRFHADVLPRDLAQARDLTYPHLAALAGRFGLDLERRTSELDADADAWFRRLEATLRLAGRYGDIRRFIEAMETGPEFLVIDAIALSRRDTERDDGLVVTQGVATYFPAPAGSSPGPAAAARATAADTVDAADFSVRLAALAAPRPQLAAAGRNPFRFADRVGADAPGAGEAAADAATVAAPGARTARPGPRSTTAGAGAPRSSLRFIAVVDAPRSAGLIAVLSDGETVFQGRVGDTIDGRYRIMSIGADTAELEFLPTGERQVLQRDGV